MGQTRSTTQQRLALASVLDLIRKLQGQPRCRQKVRRVSTKASPRIIIAIGAGTMPRSSSPFVRAAYHSVLSGKL